MFCEKCGKPNADGARFCEHCGAPMSEAVTPVPAAAPAAAAPAKPGIVRQVTELCRKNKFILPAAAAVLVVVIAVVLIVGALGKQVSLDKFLKVEVTGYDAHGCLDYELDRSTLVLRALGEKQYKAYGDFDPDSMTSDELEALEKRFSKSKIEQAGKFVDSVSVNVELPEGKGTRTLENGDVIKFELVFDEALAKKQGLTIKNTVIEYTVEGLGQPVTHDLLQNFSFTAEGYDGVGRGEIVCTKTATVKVGEVTFETEVDSRYIRYTDKDGYTRTAYVYADYSNNALSNGDVVTLTVRDLSEDSLASGGVMLTGLTKDVTVSGLQAFAEVDLLGKLNVTFSGLNGRGNAEAVAEPGVITVGDVTFDFENQAIYMNGERKSGLYISVSKRSYLSNGDVIEISVNVSDYVLTECGIKMPQKSMEVTVSGLAEYATELGQLGDGIDGLVEAGMIVVKDYLNDNWSSAVHNSWKDYSDQHVGDDMSLYAMALTTPKSTTSSTKNTLWLIYRVTLKDNTMEETPYYFAVSQNNLAVYADGTVLETITSKNKYYGYTTYAELFEKRIDAYNLNIFTKIVAEEPQIPGGDDQPAPVAPTE